MEQKQRGRRKGKGRGRGKARGVIEKHKKTQEHILAPRSLCVVDLDDDQNVYRQINVKRHGTFYVYAPHPGCIKASLIKGPT